MPDYAVPPCPTCSNPMRLRSGQYGLFYGCSTYPVCQTTMRSSPEGHPLGVFTDGELKGLRRQVQNLSVAAADHLSSTVAWVEHALSTSVLSGQAFNLHRLSKEDCQRCVDTLQATLSAPRVEPAPASTARATRPSTTVEERMASVRLRASTRRQEREPEEVATTVSTSSVYGRKLDL